MLLMKLYLNFTFSSGLGRSFIPTYLYKRFLSFNTRKVVSIMDKSLGSGTRVAWVQIQSPHSSATQCWAVTPLAAVSTL